MSSLQRISLLCGSRQRVTLTPSAACLMLFWDLWLTCLWCGRFVQPVYLEPLSTDFSILTLPVGSGASSGGTDILVRRQVRQTLFSIAAGAVQGSSAKPYHAIKLASCAHLSESLPSSSVYLGCHRHAALANILGLPSSCSPAW